MLTGLDYWLDNLMCNVPELAMCYHVDGIVQKYELVKTEDIPNICENKFSPHVVRDIAQNILSFLKSNSTKEGHTYWLFKAHGDDVIKLYDLSTLSGDSRAGGDNSATDTRAQNPFTVPVGILCYRVARNLRQTSGRKRAPVIRKLLESSLLLLDKNDYAQVSCNSNSAASDCLARSRYLQTVTSAHYLLADLYVGDVENLNASTSSGDVTSESDEIPSDESDIVHEEAANSPQANGEKVKHYESDSALPVHVTTVLHDCAPSQQESGSDAEGNSDADSPVSQLDVSHRRLQLRRVTRELQRPPPISGSPRQRCETALTHIAKVSRILNRCNSLSDY